MDFSKWMQDNCEKKGVNVTQLAAIIDEKQPTLYRIYKGLSKNPHLHIIEKLENYFGVKYTKDGSVVKQELAEYGVKPPVVVAGMKINSMEANLLKHYSKLSGSSQRAIDLMVNHLYTMEHPNDLSANPTNGKKKKETAKQ